MLVSPPRRSRSSRTRVLGSEGLAILVALLAVPLAVDARVGVPDGETGVVAVTALSGSLESDRSNEKQLDGLTSPAGPGPDPSRASVRINAGGGAYADGGGNLWEADLSYTSGGIAALDSGIEITGTSEPGLFHSTRYHTDPSGPLRYEIPLLAGSYAVRIQSVETWEDMQLGQRQFGIALEGSAVVDDFDILAATGRFGAVYTHVFEVAVADGGLSIDFVPGVLYPTVGAIEIERIALAETSPPVDGGGSAVMNGGAAIVGGETGGTAGTGTAGRDTGEGVAADGPALGAPGKPVLIR